MRKSRISVAATVTLAALLSSSIPAHAGAVELTVDGKAMPWDWVGGGLNTSRQFGIQDGVAAASVDLSTLGIAPGGNVFIFYKSGLTSAFGGSGPTVNNNGYVGSPFKDDVPGSSGLLFPSFYDPSTWGVNQTFNGNPVADPSLYGNFLNSLMGAVTDANGEVLQVLSIGRVIPIDFGNGEQQGFVIGISFQAPANAARLQLGMNDDIFFDNTGALQVCVASTDREVQACRDSVGQVSEPAPLMALLAALPAWWVARRRKS
jgi:hypothetical protein